MTQAIFLSYASQDADIARRICDALRAEGLEVWFDQSELRGGDAWDTSIRRQIRDCALFVPLISANTDSREEGYFRLEWKLAVDRSHLMVENKAFFLPVILGETAGATANVPEVFRTRQWTRLNDETAIATFAGRVAKLLSGRASPAKNASNAAPVLVFGKSAEAQVTTDAAAQAASGVASKIRAVGAAQPLQSAESTPSIAVLAFANRSGNVDDEYFSDGLADELLNVLAKIQGLRVAARTSAYSFKGKQATVAEIGRALDVATVLEGSVRKSGNRVRVSVQLVKADDGFQLWSESYDRTLDDIFAVQDDIAQSVVNELRGRLMHRETTHADMRQAGVEVSAAAKGRSQNAEAHRLYLEARFLLNRSASEDILKCIALLREALRLDPDAAALWALLASATTDAADFALLPTETALREARDAAELAVTLEPQMVEGQVAMAHFQIMLAHNWTKALRAVRRALEIAPDDAAALDRAAHVYMVVGRLSDAIACAERGTQLDPLNALCYIRLGMPLAVLGRLEESVAAQQKVLELSPNRPGARGVLAISYERLGRHAEALAEAEKETAEFARLRTLSFLHFRAGRADEGNAMLTELIERFGDDAGFNIATIYAARDDADRAFEWLERGYAANDTGLAYVKCSWMMRPLHGDPRWPAFLAKLGLDDKSLGAIPE